MVCRPDCLLHAGIAADCRQAGDLSVRISPVAARCFPQAGLGAGIRESSLWRGSRDSANGIRAALKNAAKADQRRGGGNIKRIDAAPHGDSNHPVTI